MKTQKMSLANIQGKLSRAEMKNIMAGSQTCWNCTCPSAGGAGCCGSSSYCFNFFYNACGGNSGNCTVSY